MFVAEIWRYPVKSMGGERLEACDLTEAGIPGDRIVHVEDARGRLVTSRSRPRLLLHRASLGPDGEPRVDGRPWRDPAVATWVTGAVGAPAHLVRDEGLERFDVLPLLVATDGSIAALGHDLRRLRPNLVIGGVEGLAERGWEGGTLAIGEVRIGMVDLRERCIMTTFDPDTAEQDVEVLLRIRDRFGGRMALNCEVVRGGRLCVGDPVRILPRASHPRAGLE